MSSEVEQPGLALRYSYRVQWSAEDSGFVGTVAEFPSLSSIEKYQVKALEGIVSLVQATLAEMVLGDDGVPEALADRPSVRVRVDPKAYRARAKEAYRRGMHLDELASQQFSY